MLRHGETARRRRLRRAIAIVLLLCPNASALGDPGPTVTYLMNEPVSMFSFGLYRLGEQMDRDYARDNVLASALYSWDRNRIVLTITSLMTPPEKVTKDDCRGWLSRVREDFAVAPDTGKPTDPSGSNVSSYFTPDGFSRKDEPQDLAHRLDEIVDISVVIVSSKVPVTKVECQGALLSSEALFRE